MAMFSEANLEAVGIKVRDKLRLCSICGTSLQYITGEGYCCPKCKKCWWPKPDIDPPEQNKSRCYQGGAAVYSGQSKGRKRKKPPKRPKVISNKYLDPNP